MDIRDIKEEAPEVQDRLDQIFEWQNELLEKYIVIEGMDTPPLKINLKQSQILIKDFIGRILEEMAEGLESLDKAIEETKVNKTIGGNKAIDNYKANVLPMMYNFNEECADALHFALETLIYSGISADDIIDYIDTNVMKIDYRAYDLDTGCKVDKDKLTIIYESCKARLRDNTRVGSVTNIELSEPLLYSKDINKINQGGKYITDDSLTDLLVLYAQTCYLFNLGRNTLKNKPWKQTEMATDTKVYKRYMIEGTLKLFEFFYLSGIREEHIYELYFLKNKVNQFRIKSKY